MTPILHLLSQSVICLFEYLCVRQGVFVLNFAALGVKFMMVAVKMGKGPGAQMILVVFCTSQSPPSILLAVPCPCWSQTLIIALNNTCTMPRDICILQTEPLRLYKNWVHQSHQSKLSFQIFSPFQLFKKKKNNFQWSVLSI